MPAIARIAQYLTIAYGGRINFNTADGNNVGCYLGHYEDAAA